MKILPHERNNGSIITSDICVIHAEVKWENHESYSKHSRSKLGLSVASESQYNTTKDAEIRHKLW